MIGENMRIIFALISCLLINSCANKNEELKPYNQGLDQMNDQRRQPGQTFKVATKQSAKSLSIKGPIEITADTESDQSYLGEETENVAAKIAQIQEPEKKLTGEVEITWLVPATEVDGFIVEYGYSELMQEQKVKIKTSELTKTTDSANGEVYRYILKDIPKESPLYIKIAAYKGEITSESSPVLHVK
jgi:hypothetical protein